MDIQILHRNRFRTLPGATAKAVSANAYTVTIPRTAETEKLAPKKWGIDAFDDSVLLLDDQETSQVLGSQEREAGLVVTALL